ncbi:MULTISPECIES: hypothetical protein [unclassified Streptomyces]|uniref:hypothetical protein n=1 Tax=unclassified Streptomyces TaxID=2593676 RepID=UPI00380B5A1A
MTPAASLYGIVCRVSVCTGADARRWTLALYSALDADDALWWLRTAAARMADIIDPAPWTPWCPAWSLEIVEAEPGGDPAAQLRAWCGDLSSHHAVVTGLETGRGYNKTVTDSALALRYVLSAAPQPAPYGSWPMAPAAYAA